MNSKKTKPWLRFALPFLVLFVAGGIAAVISKRPPPPKKEAQGERAAPVITAKARRLDYAPTIHGQGTVQPLSVAQVSAQVSGQVRWVSDQLKRGAQVKAGAILLKIDDRDYKARLAQAQAGVASAEAQVALAQARHESAKQEWSLSNPGKPASELVLQLPQLRAAEAALRSAKAAVELATLAWQRCTIKAPLDAVVQSRQVTKGDLVGPGRPLATLLPAKESEVAVSLPRSDLEKLGGGSLANVTGMQVKMRFQVGKTSHEIPGTLVRILGELDRVGRMAQVIIQPDGDAGGDLPFGAFVQVEMTAQAWKDVVVIPARALQSANKVYLVQSDRLVTRQMTLLHREPDTVVVQGPLEDGDIVIASKVRGLVEGMLIKTIGTASEGLTEASTEGQP